MVFIHKTSGHETLNCNYLQKKIQIPEDCFGLPTWPTFVFDLVHQWEDLKQRAAAHSRSLRKNSHFRIHFSLHFKTRLSAVSSL